MNFCENFFWGIFGLKFQIFAEKWKRFSFRFCWLNSSPNSKFTNPTEDNWAAHVVEKNALKKWKPRKKKQSRLTIRSGRVSIIKSTYKIDNNNYKNQHFSCPYFPSRGIYENYKKNKIKHVSQIARFVRSKIHSVKLSKNYNKKMKQLEKLFFSSFKYVVIKVSLPKNVLWVFTIFFLETFLTKNKINLYP